MTDKKKTDDISPLDRIRQYEMGISKEVESLKTDLAKQLTKAAEMAGVLNQLGKTDWKEDPQSYDARVILGIGIEPKQSVAVSAIRKNPYKRKSGQPTAKEFIVGFLKDQKEDTHKQAILSNGQTAGYGLPALNAAIQQLSKSGEITAVTRGTYRLMKKD